MSEFESMDQAVAIIGMSGRFPGARNVDEFWQLLVEGGEGITGYSEQELADAGVPAELISDPRYVRSAHPLAGFGLFDAEFFGLTSTEAAVIDPQHRVFLESAWQAMEDAGYRPGGTQARTGVFAGISGNDYRAWAAAHPAAHPLQVSIGNDPAMLALRTSYQLDLTGPSLTVQTACSSSLVAVHMAVVSLLTRECDLALAGGAAVRFLHPQGHLYEEGGILSTDGHCRAFDSSATGTASGDGVGVVVLKRYKDALAGGDRIRAVIIGSAVNNDGSSKIGFTAPAEQGQAAVIAEALAVAGVDPATIGYVEAHGTGTPLGDPIEVRALTEAFGPAVPPGSCLLGSVKSNIGHLDTAAGVAGLVKATLALEHRFVPPTVHFSSPNPQCGLDTSPFRVNAEGTPWPAADHPPRAGVSSFGIGGTNVHVVLQAAPQLPRPEAEHGWHVLPVSGRTPQALVAATANLAEHLAQHPEQPLADVAFTLQTGRAEFANRHAVVASDTEGASEALRRPAVPALAGRPPKVVFVFPGQGSQYAGMGAQLYRSAPTFAQTLDECAELLAPRLGWDVREVAFAEGEQAAIRLRQTGYTQPAMFSLDYAMARQLIAWGIKPDAMIGHSLGELVGACLAGVFELDDALALVISRARLMQQLPAGRMISVQLAERELERLLDGEASIAALNGPNSCVVAGTVAQIEAAQRRLDGYEVRELHTSHAFHTPMVEPILPQLRDAVCAARLDKPRIPVLSNVTGGWLSSELAIDPEYWVRHTRAPVRFADGVRTALELTGAVFVEVGPGDALSGLVKFTAGAETTVVATMRRPREQDAGNEPKALLEAVAQLWRHGVPVDWHAQHGDRARRRVPLPTYPFQRTEHLVPARSVSVSAEFGTQRREPSRWSYVPVWHPAPVRQPDGSAPPANWLVLGDRHGLGQQIAQRLRRDGHRVDTVAPCEPQELRRRVRELRDGGHPPQRVLHAWSLAAEETEGTAAAQAAGETADWFRRSLDRGLFSLVAIAQECSDLELRVDLLTNDLQDVHGDGVSLPERATLLGAATVLDQEFPGLRCRMIDVHLPAGDLLVDQLCTELAAEQRDLVVAYRAGRRYRQAFAPIELDQPAGAWPSGAYLVTGASEQARTFVEQLKSAGADVVHIEDLSAARDAVRAARERFGRFAGVVHAVDERTSGLAALKTVEQIETGLAGVLGTVLLDELCPDEPMLICSSVTGIVGGFGQLENCAVGAFLDAFGQARAARGAPTVTVDWGLWEWDDWLETQMAAMPQVREQYLRQRRELGIPVADGVPLAASILASGFSRVVVSTVDFQEVLAGRATLTTSAFIDSIGQARPGELGGFDPVSVFPDDEVAQSVAMVWHELLGVGHIGPDDDFYDLGGNSLFAIQIVSRLRQIHGDLPMSAIFEAPTVPGLAAAIRERQTEQIGLDEFEALLAEVESLSAEEVEARLGGEHA